MSSEEIVDAFRNVTKVYRYVDKIIIDLDKSIINSDDNSEGNGFKVLPNKFPRILKFSYNNDSNFIKTEWGEIHSIIKLYQRNADTDAYIYGVATLFDFCNNRKKQPLIVIAKYTLKTPCGIRGRTFWNYYWPIQRRSTKDFKFEQHNDYCKSEPLVKKYNIKETVFKEIDFLELSRNSNIEERILKELNLIIGID